MDRSSRYPHTKSMGSPLPLSHFCPCLPRNNFSFLTPRVRHSIQLCHANLKLSMPPPWPPLTYSSHHSSFHPWCCPGSPSPTQSGSQPHGASSSFLHLSYSLSLDILCAFFELCNPLGYSLWLVTPYPPLDLSSEVLPWDSHPDQPSAKTRLGVLTVLPTQTLMTHPPFVFPSGPGHLRPIVITSSTVQTCHYERAPVADSSGFESRLHLS